jgi:hypothetical protein
MRVAGDGEDLKRDTDGFDTVLRIASQVWMTSSVCRSGEGRTSFKQNSWYESLIGCSTTQASVVPTAPIVSAK